MVSNIPGGEFLTGSLDVISQSLTIPVLVILLVIVIGSVPILRTLIMIEHEWLHSFFTYRAFGATILAVLMIIFAAAERRKRC